MELTEYMLKNPPSGHVGTGAPQESHISEEYVEVNIHARATNLFRVLKLREPV